MGEGAKGLAFLAPCKAIFKVTKPAVLVKELGDGDASAVRQLAEGDLLEAFECRRTANAEANVSRLRVTYLGKVGGGMMLTDLAGWVSTLDGEGTECLEVA